MTHRASEPKLSENFQNSEKRAKFERFLKQKVRESMEIEESQTIVQLVYWDEFTLAMIEVLEDSGSIGRDDLRYHLDRMKNASRHSSRYIIRARGMKARSCSVVRLMEGQINLWQGLADSSSRGQREHAGGLLRCAVGGK